MAIISEFGYSASFKRIQIPNGRLRVTAVAKTDGGIKYAEGLQTALYCLMRRRVPSLQLKIGAYYWIDHVKPTTIGIITLDVPIN
jgi:hypothetical protein